MWNAFVYALKSGGELAAAGFSLLTIGQAGWVEMGDALQSLLRLIRSMFVRVGSAILSPIESITTLFRLARNSVPNVIEFLQLLVNKISSDLIVPALDSLTTVFQSIVEFFADPTPALNNLLNLLRSAGDNAIAVLNFLKRFPKSDVWNALMSPTKWGNLIEVARRLELPEYAAIRAAITPEYADAIGAIIEFGPDALDILLQRNQIMGDVLPLWTKRLSFVSAQEGAEILEGVQFALEQRQRLDLNVTNSRGVLTNNVGYAEFNIQIPGTPDWVGKRENWIGVSSPNVFAGTVRKPPAIRRFSDETPFPYNFDSEAMIFEEIAEQIINSGASPDSVTGNITIFTERKPCDHCTRIILQQWNQLFPRIKIEKVIHGPRYLSPGDLSDLDNFENFTDVLR